MGDKFKVWAKDYHYNGGYGHAKKETVHDPYASRFDTNFFSPEDRISQIHDGMAGDMVTYASMRNRFTREQAMDRNNPKEKIPEDLISAKLIEVAPEFAYTQTMPGNDQATDQVKLVQQAFINAAKQETLFTSPENFGDESLNTDKVGQGVQPLKQVDAYSMDGSAAGKISNNLYGEKQVEDNRLQSVESMTAF